MKLRIEISADADEEVVIRCRSMTGKACAIRDLVSKAIGAAAEMLLTIGDTEYYIPCADILFFETADGRVTAHTAERMYYTESKLYELDQLLPRSFVRVSKSCIINSERVCAIDKSLTGASEAFFKKTHKRVYVSRMYLKDLKRIIEETRLFL